MKTNYRGFLIRRANATGGKAGKGLNKTSTIQVSREGMLEDGHLKGHFYKQIRFNVNDPLSYHDALVKAVNLVDSVIKQEEEKNENRKRHPKTTP